MKYFLPILAFFIMGQVFAQKDLHVIGFYTKTVENDHVDFANDAIKFFKEFAAANKFTFDTTTNWANHNDDFLKNYQVIMWINEFPHTEQERRAFERYMIAGGGWIGFHVSGYNDKETGWPWFVDFMGGAVFNNNNWPPLAATLIVDNQKHPVTRGMPATYRSPINEWYQWKPSPRLNKDVQVLVTLDSANYPLGKKHSLTKGDIPVVWTNTRYKMLYMNMGHGDKVMTDPLQNAMIGRGLLWVGRRKK